MSIVMDIIRPLRAILVRDGKVNIEREKHFLVAHFSAK